MTRPNIMLASVSMTFPISTTAYADMGGHHFIDSMQFGGWHFGPLMWAIALALIVVAFGLALRGLRAHSQGSIEPGQALNILKERFARGEIDRAEYDERRIELSK